MPILFVPLLQKHLLPLFNEPPPPSGENKDRSSAWRMANRAGELDPVLRTVAAEIAEQAAGMAEMQNPGHVALRDRITALYRWNAA
jgi:hypothetical protein